MPRLKRKKNSLRGSVTQNIFAPRARAKTARRFGLIFRLGVFVGFLVFLIGLSLWLWHIRWPQQQMERASNAAVQFTQKAKFAVKDIIVEGRGHTNRDELYNALGAGSGTPIIMFDPEVAHERVSKLPWVASASIERRLPDTIIVRLTERVPIARWQNNNKIIVIDREGKELPNASLEQFAQLPLVVGDDAPAKTQALLNELQKAPIVTAAMKAAARVGGRRWDLYLQPKIIARLPEKNIAEALQKLSQLIRDQKVLERDIIAIDLRLTDRLVLEQGNNPSARPTGAPKI